MNKTTPMPIFMRTVVYGVAILGSKILVVQQKQGVHQWKFDLPGGGIDPGETIDEALRREFMEEVGMSFGSMTHLYNFTAITEDAEKSMCLHQIGLIYRVEALCKIEHQNPELEYVWLGIDECTKLEHTPFLKKRSQKSKMRHTEMHVDKFEISPALVRRLVFTQFPQGKDLSIEPTVLSGWDNRTFHLGKDMLVRMPSAAKYASQVEKEHKWLPKLALLLPLAIPEPLALGKPAEGYPWKWSIYRYLEGDTAASVPPSNLSDFAKSLAQFLLVLQRIDPTAGPLHGPDNFYRHSKND